MAKELESQIKQTKQTMYLKYKCDIELCTYVAANQDQIISHLKAKHGDFTENSKVWSKCPYCLENYPTHHSHPCLMESGRCPICKELIAKDVDKVKYQIQKLYNHMRMRHFESIKVRKMPHTRLTSTKRFTNLNLDVIVVDNRGFHISYEFEYFYQCIITS